MSRLSMTDNLRTRPETKPVVRAPRKRRFPWLVAPAAVFYLIFFGCPLAQMIWQSLWSDGFTLSGYLSFTSEPAYWWMLGYTLVLGSGMLLLVLAFLIAPILIIIAVSFSPGEMIMFPPQGLSLRWHQHYFNDINWMNATHVNVMVAIITALCSLLLGTMVSVGLVRGTFPGKNLPRALLMEPLIAPKIITTVGLYFLYMHLRLLGTAIGLVIAHTLIAVPYVVMIMTAALYGFDRRLEWAARSPDASTRHVICHISWPVLRPAIISATLFSFIASFDDIILSLFLSQLTQPTLPRQIWVNVQQFIDSTIAAVSTLMTLVSVLGLGLVMLVQWLAARRTVQTVGQREHTAKARARVFLPIVMCGVPAEGLQQPQTGRT